MNKVSSPEDVSIGLDQIFTHLSSLNQNSRDLKRLMSELDLDVFQGLFEKLYRGFDGSLTGILRTGENECMVARRSAVLSDGQKIQTKTDIQFLSGEEFSGYKKSLELMDELRESLRQAVKSYEQNKNDVSEVLLIDAFKKAYTASPVSFRGEVDPMTMKLFGRRTYVRLGLSLVVCISEFQYEILYAYIVADEEFNIEFSKMLGIRQILLNGPSRRRSGSIYNIAHKIHDTRSRAQKMLA